MTKPVMPWPSHGVQVELDDIVSLGNFTYLHTLAGQATTYTHTTVVPILATATATAATPTVSDFLNGAISEYVLDGVPDGMRPFLVDGQQLSLHNSFNGAVAHTWVTDDNQVLITYAGTTRGENLLDPLATAGGLLSDLQILAQQMSSAQLQSLDFARDVIQAAAAQGYGTGDIFVTGHSLGAISASYVAQQTGLGGMGFEASGIPLDTDAVGTGQCFVNVVTLGDPIANYASDIAGEQPFAPTFDLTGGSLPHYGSLFVIGAQSDQADLASAAAKVGHLFTGDDGGQVDLIGGALHAISVAAGLAEAVRLIAEFHLPASLYTLPSQLGTAHSPINLVGSYDIPELQAYAQSHVTYG